MPDVTVAPGVDLYYELHGEGAHKVLMIMGECKFLSHDPTSFANSLKFRSGNIQ
jgi:hypothetical protein